uniref:PDZ and pleckstrin homology domains 1 n=1 Tax=Esox lucius TaxID=8010 RepID=A0A3P9A8M8_ESOLU
MSRRGSRRRNSRRRKSSTSSKQGVSPYVFRKQNKSNSVVDDITEKGEIESLHKENILSASDEEEEQSSEIPSKEKKLKRDSQRRSSQNNRTSSITKQEDKDRQVKFTTSVIIDDLQQSSSKIIFRHCHIGSNVKFEIQEILPSDHSGTETVYVFQSQEGATAESCAQSQCDKGLSPDNDSFLQSWTLKPNVNLTVHSQNQLHSYELSVPKSSRDTSVPARHSTASRCWGKSACRKSCCDEQYTLYGSPLNDTDLTTAGESSSLNHLSEFWRSTDALWDIPPPQEFSDCRYDNLEDLAKDIASCQIDVSGNTDRQQGLISPPPSMRHHKDSGCPYSTDGDDGGHLESFFDQMSESDNYEPMFMRPSSSVSWSSYTKEFIQNHEMKTQMRNNSISTVERKPCSSSSYLQKPTKRRRTFPGVEEEPSRIQEGMPSWVGRESFSSDTISSYIKESLSLQAQKLSKCPADSQEVERLYSINVENCKLSSSNCRPSSSNANRHVEPQRQMINTVYLPTAEETSKKYTLFPELKHPLYEYPREPDMSFGDNPFADIHFGDKQIEVAESGFDEEMGEAEDHSTHPTMKEFNQRDLLIQVIPPSRTCSEEHIPESSPSRTFSNGGNMGVVTKTSWQQSAVNDHLQPRQRRGSVMTLQIGDTEQRFLQNDSKTAESSALNSAQWEAFNVISEAPSVSSTQEMEEMDPEIPNESTEEVILTSHRSFTVRGSISSPALSQIEEDKEPNLEENKAEDSGMATSEAPSLSQESPDQETVNKQKPKLYQIDSTEKKSVSKSSLEVDSGPEPWARRRNLFKDSKQWSSAGGSSINSSINEESGISEDSRSMDMAAKDLGDKGFYTETFHSASWIYSGDDISPTAAPVPPVRERTVKIWKGMGDYPWGFRIQFSKPIVVTEVDTNGAAEEAGLLVGDFVIAVNGIDVTSIPHSEAADLARQGPDLLTLTIGSDIARSPNTPRLTCRGYLHKRTQKGLIKGWRRRWFVLRHDSYLYYYRHKKDEGRKRALSSFKLEGAEVKGDPSLGKPFVFKCCPLLANRAYHFSATSNLEMKRWLDAMERAVHPITQNHVWVDVTRHNASLPPLAVKNPECLGLLHQIDRNNKDAWVQHYCILKDGCLYFYAGIRSTHALGGIYLHGYTIRDQPLGSKKSTIELKPPSNEFKTFYLCAENPAENKRWISALKTSSNKWLPYHQAIQDYMNRPPEETRM